MNTPNDFNSSNTNLSRNKDIFFGFVKDITFETKSGELINVVVKDATPYVKNLNLERVNATELLIPHSAIIAIGDFVIVSEEDLI